MPRKFIQIDETKPKDPQNEFRILTWNILARALCALDSCSRAPNESYDWLNFRMWRTLEELVRHDCDILCLEETDTYEDIKPFLHAIGFVLNNKSQNKNIRKLRI